MVREISIFTTATNPCIRGDTVVEALACYSDLADEVVIMDGTFTQATDKKWHQELGYYENYDTDDEIWIEPRIDRRIINEWPKEFDWPFIGQQFQHGYEECTGDWVIHCDLDFIFHEKDYEKIRQAFKDNPDAPALSFYKYQFILPDSYNLKSRLVIAVNKGKYGDRIRFDSGGDLCQPSLDGEYIKPDTIPESRIPFYNYEKILKTKEQIMDDVGRMERAYKRHFGKYQYGSDGTNEDAYNKWYEAQKGKFKKPQEKIKLEDHPKVMQETIKNLKPENFGYNGFGLIDGKVYE